MNTPASRARRTLSTFGGVEDLHALIDTVPDAMVVIDAGGSIMSFSRGAEHMFGYIEAEVLGENVSMLMPSPDREQHDAYLGGYLKTGQKRIIGIGRVTTARRRDGSTFPIDLAVGEVMLREERVFAGFIRDLTERRETERLLHNLQGELAHASRITSMGTLATSIAHELNQPLTAVTNYAQAARDLLGDLTPENVELVREALHETATEALRAGQIVHRLRDFISRGESTREVASLQRMVTETTALALLDVKVRNTNFTTRLVPACDAVLVDPVQVQQVLLNLMRNALDAMADMPVKQLDITSAPDAGGMVRVTLSDRGSGISPEIAGRLFQPFVSTKDSGMGLGLSICHTIVASHGGKIWAEPSEGGGTAFHFTLMSADSEGPA
ncbi:MAG: PAS domain S-box protein [Candidatus Andeanibacterium colombiense]|uniref:Sensor protein FixL n=1 Tax=Candidatus Andeanibacterium colombiense TaxID=3121345 RepID=A0AAJ5XAW4_9SPHN|nr:MAG: PAS domain S-box protein [Sphingomonadaceae bacterium]